MQIATSPTRERYPLSPKKILKKTLSKTIILVILLLIIWIVIALVSLSNFSAMAPLFFFGSVGVGVLLVLLVGSVYLYQRWYFAVYFYDLTNDYIVIKKGPITPSEITIPYERIQDVYVDQDLLDRFFGLYDVHLSSATAASGMEAHIDGVEKLAADGLRTDLLKTVQERISKHRQASAPAPLPPVNQ